MLGDLIRASDTLGFQEEEEEGGEVLGWLFWWPFTVPGSEVAFTEVINFWGGCDEWKPSKLMTWVVELFPPLHCLYDFLAYATPIPFWRLLLCAISV